MNDKNWNFEKLPVFLECHIDFHDFQEQIWLSHNARHVCPKQHVALGPKQTSKQHSEPEAWPF